MNHYLDHETHNAIRKSQLRFDDDLKGKTVKASVYGTPMAISFTDGTWCGIYADDDGCGDHCCYEADRMSLSDLRDLELITEEQYKAADAKEQEAKRSRKQEEIDRLQKELNSGRIW